MTKEDKNLKVDIIISSVQRIPTKRDSKAALLRQVKNLQAICEIEKDCKNKAYYFILANDLLDKFSSFRELHNASNAHKQCVSTLYANTFNR